MLDLDLAVCAGATPLGRGRRRHRRRASRCSPRGGLRQRRARDEHADTGAGRGSRGAVALKPLGRDFYRRDSAEVAPDLLNKVLIARRGGPHRRGRGLRRRRTTRRATPTAADRAQRHHVRTGRAPLRLLHLRHALVRQRGVRGRGRRQRGAAARARAARRRRGDADARGRHRPDTRCAPDRRSCARRSPSTATTTAPTWWPAIAASGSSTTARRRRASLASRRIGISVGVEHPWRWFVRGDANLSRRG